MKHQPSDVRTETKTATEAEEKFRRARSEAVNTCVGGEAGNQNRTETKQNKSKQIKRKKNITGGCQQKTCVASGSNPEADTYMS